MSVFKAYLITMVAILSIFVVVVIATAVDDYNKQQRRAERCKAIIAANMDQVIKMTYMQEWCGER